MRIAALAGLPALAVLSLVPADMAIDGGIPGSLDHLAAYAVVGAALAAARLGRPRRLVLGLGVYAAVLEGLQHLSPGREPSLVDGLASTAGALVGVGAVAAVLDRRARLRDLRPSPRRSP